VGSSISRYCRREDQRAARLKMINDREETNKGSASQQPLIPPPPVPVPVPITSFGRMDGRRRRQWNSNNEEDDDEDENNASSASSDDQGDSSSSSDEENEEDKMLSDAARATKKRKDLSNSQRFEQMLFTGLQLVLFRNMPTPPPPPPTLRSSSSLGLESPPSSLLARKSSYTSLYSSIPASPSSFGGRHFGGRRGSVAASQVGGRLSDVHKHHHHHNNHHHHQQESTVSSANDELQQLYEAAHYSLEPSLSRMHLSVILGGLHLIWVSKSEDNSAPNTPKGDDDIEEIQSESDSDSGSPSSDDEEEKKTNANESSKMESVNLSRVISIERQLIQIKTCCGTFTPYNVVTLRTADEKFGIGSFQEEGDDFKVLDLLESCLRRCLRRCSKDAAALRTVMSSTPSSFSTGGTPQSLASPPPPPSPSFLLSPPPSRSGSPHLLLKRNSSEKLTMLASSPNSKPSLRKLSFHNLRRASRSSISSNDSEAVYSEAVRMKRIASVDSSTGDISMIDDGGGGGGGGGERLERIASVESDDGVALNSIYRERDSTVLDGRGSELNISMNAHDDDNVSDEEGDIVPLGDRNSSLGRTSTSSDSSRLSAQRLSQFSTFSKAEAKPKPSDSDGRRQSAKKPSKGGVWNNYVQANAGTTKGAEGKSVEGLPPPP
jgi:hypothetical protein